MSQVREYTVRAQSTDTFGRVLCNARNHHFIVDGPVQNGCPGEAITPVEQFLSAVAACGVELVQVIAKEQDLQPPRVHVTIEGMVDRSRPIRPELTLFNRVQLRFRIDDVDRDTAADLVERFKGR